MAYMFLSRQKEASKDPQDIGKVAQLTNTPTLFLLKQSQCCSVHSFLTRPTSSGDIVPYLTWDMIETNIDTDKEYTEETVHKSHTSRVLT